MKIWSIASKIVFVVLGICLANIHSNAQEQRINAVIGDESATTLFSTLPAQQLPEEIRIQTHLMYVLQKLESKPAGNLSYQQKINRQYILTLLKQYIIIAQFPTNTKYLNERRPCFIDEYGNICAVGYLIAETYGMNMAEQINNQYQYEYVMNMKSEALADWADEYGLTLEECAMIQPTYGNPSMAPVYYADIKTSYGLSSGALGGVNLASNLQMFANKNAGKAWGFAGLVGGSTQVILGLSNIRKTSFANYPINGSSYISYKAQNNLSYVNIAMGTATLVNSYFHIRRQAKNKNSSSMVNVYSIPNEANSLSLGLSLSHRF